MFKIVAPTQALIKFLLLLQLRFSEPQQRHLANFIEALLACDGTKTIAKLNRLIVDATDQSAFTDFFTYSTWDNGELQRCWQSALVGWVLGDNQLALVAEPLYIGIDDSGSKKPKTSLHFEITDWHFDTTEGRGFGYGVVFVTVHLARGKRSAPIALRLYLRARTVRRINRVREKNRRLPFKTKFEIVKEILQELAPLIPSKVPVYVLFDSWYASAKLIKLCRQWGWHVICALKHNRSFRTPRASDWRQLSQWARTIRNKDFKEVTVKSSDSSTRYWVYTLRGRLKGLKDEVSIIISKQHYKDKRPKFFLVTDLTLSTQEALSRYMRRWPVEVDHLYLKVRLGLGDFRLRSYEGIAKYFDLVGLTLAYLYWRKVEEAKADIKTLSDVIALHRHDQQEAFLRAFGELVLKCGSVDQAMVKWSKQTA